MPSDIGRVILAVMRVMSCVLAGDRAGILATAKAAMATRMALANVDMANLCGNLEGAFCD
jgi:hypothetical protein